MSDIQRDLFNQGLDNVSEADVVASFDLFERDRRYDPNFVYDPTDTTWEDRIYAPTAAEMEPDRAPKEWPNG